VDVAHIALRRAVGLRCAMALGRVGWYRCWAARSCMTFDDRPMPRSHDEGKGDDVLGQQSTVFFLTAR
jgi:hypothetical protein